MTERLCLCVNDNAQSFCSPLIAQLCSCTDLVPSLMGASQDVVLNAHQVAWCGPCISGSRENCRADNVLYSTTFDIFAFIPHSLTDS